MRKLLNRNEKGITLIALIVTIIVILVLAGVAISMLMGENGLLNQADKAVKEMDAAQVKERAEMVKLSVMMEKLTDKNATIMGVKTEFLNKLKAEFGADSEIKGDKITIANGKYNIVVNNNLDMEVGEGADSNTNKIEEEALVIAEYSNTKNTEENTINIELKYSPVMTLNEYIDYLKAQDNIETEAVIITGDFCGNSGYTGEQKTFSELILADFNAWYDTNYTSIEDCTEDENIQAETGYTTVKGLYYWWWAYTYSEENETEEMTIDEIIEYGIQFYADAVYYPYTRNLRLFVSENGTEKEITNNENKIDISSGTKTINYTIEENGTYEFILKLSNGKRVITSEKFIINNL